MNPFDWFFDWRMKRQVNRDCKLAQEQVLQAERDAQRDQKLRGLCDRLSTELWSKKFNVINWRTRLGDDTALVYAITPNGRLVVITVGIEGGISIKDISK